MGARSNMTDDEKRDVVARVFGGEKSGAVAKELKISTNTLAQWRKRFASTISKPSAKNSKADPKPKVETSSKKTSKRKPSRKSKAAPASVTLLSAHHVNDEWCLPHPLGELVVCAEILRDADDFDVLERLEKAVAVQRELMARRAA